MENLTLREQLNGAELVLTDDNMGLTLAWFGGHGVNIYADDGTEVHYFTIGTPQTKSVTFERAVTLP